MSRLKGTNLTHTRAYVESAFGLEGWATVAAEMAPADRAAMEGVIAMGWYPDVLLVRLFRAVEAGLGARDREVLQHCGAFAADYDVSRFHRLLFRGLNPGLLLEKGMDIWERHFDSGRWTVERPSPTSATGTLADFAIADAGCCRYLLGYLQRVFAIVGAKDVRVRHPRCRARGDAVCKFDGDWK